MINFNDNPRTIFLIDGIGAIVSAVMLGIVLPLLQDLIGMPTEVLYYLASAAVMFAIYSLSCAFIVPANWPTFLRIIAFVNLTYCVVSVGLVYYFYPQLTKLGIAYFAIEKLIVIYIVMMELKAANK